MLLVGADTCWQSALAQALGRHGIFVETASLDSVVQAATTAAPDLVVLADNAAEHCGLPAIRRLATSPLTKPTPIVVLDSGSDVDARLQAFRGGAIAVLGRSASVDFVAERIAALARGLPDTGGATSEPLGEVTLDQLVAAVRKEIRSRVLSARGFDPCQGVSIRLVLGAGRPLAALIDEFVHDVRRHVIHAEPLCYEPTLDATSLLTDADLPGEPPAEPADGEVLRLMLVDNNAVRADVMAQALREHGARVIVTNPDARAEFPERLPRINPNAEVMGNQHLAHGKNALLHRLWRDMRARWAPLVGPRLVGVSRWWQAQCALARSLPIRRAAMHGTLGLALQAALVTLLVAMIAGETKPSGLQAQLSPGSMAVGRGAVLHARPLPASSPAKSARAPQKRSGPRGELGSGARSLPDEPSAVVPGCSELLARRGDAPRTNLRTTLEQATRGIVRGDLETAQYRYCTALRQSPRAIEAMVGLTRVLMMRQAPQPATEWAERAARQVPDDPDVHALLGDALARAGQYDEARPLWLGAAGIVTGHSGQLKAWVERQRATARRASTEQRFDLAERLYRRVSVMEPDDSVAAIGLSQVLLLQRQPAPALAWARHAIAVQPQSADAWVALAHALSATGDPTGAQAASARADELDPGAAMRYYAPFRRTPGRRQTRGR